MKPTLNLEQVKADIAVRKAMPEVDGTADTFLARASGIKATRRSFTPEVVDAFVVELEEQRKQLAAVVAENAGLKTVLEEIINADQPEYHDQGMGCGVEDRGYQRDGYSACYYGWESAMERVYSEVIPESLPETPATDAYLAEVRAQARNELIDELTARFTELAHTLPTDLQGGAAGAAGFVSTFRQGAAQ